MGYMLFKRFLGLFDWRKIMCDSYQSLVVVPIMVDNDLFSLRIELTIIDDHWMAICKKVMLQF